MLTSAIRANDAHMLGRLLSRPHHDVSPILLDLLAQACEHKCSSAVMRTILEHKAFSVYAVFGPRKETALDIAIKHNDFPLASDLLNRGADPDECRGILRSDEMRHAYSCVRIRNHLYPQGKLPQDATDLDRALLGGEWDRATDFMKTLLNVNNIDGTRIMLTTAHLKSRSVHNNVEASVMLAWRAAVKDNRTDVLRAIIMLGYASAHRTLRLSQEEKDKLADPGIIAAIKELPTFSPKRKTLEMLNGLASFKGVKKKIVCRHLVTHQHDVQSAGPAIKFDYDTHFRGLATISKRVKPDVEAKFRHLMARASETYLIKNTEFGAFLARQFEEMERRAGAGMPTAKLLTVGSDNHVMSFGLRIKYKEGRKIYVAKFYDPNITRTHVRSASGSLKTFETHKLAMYINGYRSMKDYYPEGDAHSLVHARPVTTRNADGSFLSAKMPENRTLTNAIDEGEASASIISILLARGFSGNLRQLKKEIEGWPEAKKIALVDVLSDPLKCALMDGYADAVKAFGEISNLVPEHARTKAVVARSESSAGTCGIHSLLISKIPNEDEVDATIKEYEALLSGLPEQSLYELLATKDSSGKPWLHGALRNNDLKAVRRYIRIVNDMAPGLSKEKRTDLLNVIKSCHAFRLGGKWIDHPHYILAKTKHPEFYKEFKAMKTALKA